MHENLYNAERIRNILKPLHLVQREIKMFGGICFMVDEKMCCGTFQGGIMARVDPVEIKELLNKPGASQMMQKGRTMKGFIMVGPDGFDMDEDLEFWIQKCLEYNPKVKAKKKK